MNGWGGECKGERGGGRRGEAEQTSQRTRWRPKTERETNWAEFQCQKRKQSGRLGNTRSAPGQIRKYLTLLFNSD